MKRIFTLQLVFVALSFSYANAQSSLTFKYKVGDYEVMLLSENQGNGNTSILINPGEEVLKKYVPDGTFKNAVNAFLVKTPEKNILFDAGFGRELFNNLKSFGVEPSDIECIMLTHMHGDHIGGLLVNDEIAFPNASLILSRVEKEYWEKGDKNSGQNKVLNKYKDKIEVVEPIENVPAVDGVYPVEAYGHTPGHVCFMVVSKGEKLLIWGDLTHAMAVQMPHPEVAVTYDVDPDITVKSR